MRALALLLLLASAGCYHLRYTNGPDAQPAPQPLVWHHNFIYGLVELDGTDVDRLCPQGFARVEHQMKPLDAVLEALVGGRIWEPSSVEVWCASAQALPPPAPEGPPAFVPPPPAALPSAPPVVGRACVTPADCQPGELCRDRGDGAARCAPRGSVGAFCAAAHDCAAGLACKDPGDGIKKCVGHGVKGDPCVAPADCQAGLKCGGHAPLRSCQ